jgi:hypothetical protein
MHAEGNGLILIHYVSSTGWEKNGLYDPPGTRHDFLLLVGYRMSESQALGSLEVRTRQQWRCWGAWALVCLEVHSEEEHLGRLCRIFATAPCCCC